MATKVSSQPDGSPCTSLYCRQLWRESFKVIPPISLHLIPPASCSSRGTRWPRSLRCQGRRPWGRRPRPGTGCRAVGSWWWPGMFNSPVSHLNWRFSVSFCGNCWTLRKMDCFISICISIFNFEVFKMGMTVLIWAPICKLKCRNANRDAKWNCWTLSWYSIELRKNLSITTSMFWKFTLEAATLSWWWVKLWLVVIIR